MKYAEHIADLVGNTPLVKLHSVTEGIAVGATLKLVRGTAFTGLASAADRGELLEEGTGLGGQ